MHVSHDSHKKRRGVPAPFAAALRYLIFGFYVCPSTCLKNTMLSLSASASLRMF